MGQNYKELPDEKIIKKIHDGDQAAMDFMLNKYKSFVKQKARTMFLIGGDTDDLIQEGMIGLYKAIRDYREDKEASFYSFASICVSNQIFTAVNTANRKKHSPLNDFVSIHGLTQEENTGSLPGKELNPEELFIDKENVSMIEYYLESNLSKYELQVIRLFIEGNSYTEIAERMDKSPKSIDNALQRIRNKVLACMKSNQ